MDRIKYLSTPIPTAREPYEDWVKRIYGRNEAALATRTMGPVYRDLDTRPVLYPTSRDVADRLWSKLPTLKDLSDEACREIRRRITGVEIMSTTAMRALRLDDGYSYSRDQFYGNLEMDSECGFGPSTNYCLDLIRGEAMQFARAYGVAVARNIEHVVDVSPTLREASARLALRIATPMLLIPIQGRAEGERIVLVDDVSVGFVLRFASYYFVTPQGKEKSPCVKSDDDYLERKLAALREVDDICKLRGLQISDVERDLAALDILNQRQEQS